MPRTRSRSARRALMVAVAVLVAVVGLPALARAATGERVKYYQVLESYQGKPENLAEIAVRFLGSANRAQELFALNAGRVQPDGGKLTDPNVLKKGWLIVLAWDAVGDGVKYGELPPAPKPTTAKPPGGVPPVVTSSSPTPPPVASPSPAAASACGGAPPAGADAVPWAQQRLAPQQVWAASRGDGVVVAVIDSGVDATVPQLAGRVSAGADIVNGTTNGNVDCLGSGTAMAGLIAAQSDGGMVGMAPDATILPIRVVTDTPSATVADQATAIDVAVSGGARVIALGSFVDLNAPAVRQAAENAGAHDVVVVVGAAAAGTGALPAQVIRVGAMGSDGRMAQDYPAGSMDVVAPGVDVTSLGIAGRGVVRGTGTQYAVALVAGAVALVRAKNAAMSADAVVSRLRVSAKPLAAGAVPDQTSGWGLIDLPQALEVPAQPAPSSGARGGGTGGTLTALLTVIAVLALAVGGLLLFRRRRAQRYGLDLTSAVALDTYDVSHPTNRSAIRSATSTDDDSSWRDAHTDSPLR